MGLTEYENEKAVDVVSFVSSYDVGARVLREKGPLSLRFVRGRWGKREGIVRNMTNEHGGE